MMSIGIMQGRLLPPIGDHFQCFPREQWADEVFLAKEAGLSGIEWIYDLYGADVNPLATDAGIEKMKLLSARHGVAIHSVCADYFMDRPFLRASRAELAERVTVLRWLLQRCQLLAIDRIVLPFVDSAKINTPEDIEQVIALLNSVLETAAAMNIELHLETSLPPNEFAAMLARISHPLVKVNFDSGNSAALGYDLQEEFLAYGERIGSVHVKDRLRDGGTVPLGTGDAKLDLLFDALEEIGYNRNLILQVARDISGEEVTWAKKNRSFVEELLFSQRSSQAIS